MGSARRRLFLAVLAVAAAAIVVGAFLPGRLARSGTRANLLDDPSFEMPKERDQFGVVFAKWKGWKYEGDCDFGVGRVAHSGKTSCWLMGSSEPKIRAWQEQELEPGRYKVTAYLRGLDIGLGGWNVSTEFMFDGQYMQLGKNGTFGWTKLTYVGEIKKKHNVSVSFGLMAPGDFWIDDVKLEKVGNNVALTATPQLSGQEAPIAPPSKVGAQAVRCPHCGYRNMPSWKSCYACGTPLAAPNVAVGGPPRRLITSFEDKNPFDGASVVSQHATNGARALLLKSGYAAMVEKQNWTGFDYLKADLFTSAKAPLDLYVEIRDANTSDYWTRVNYQTVVPPGKSTLVLPIKHLYVGEKARPGRALILGAIERLVFSIGEKPEAPLFLDNIQLERDTTAQQARFEGLHAFDFGTGTSPVMDGFTQITPATQYSEGRGYGLQEAKVWRSFDALQPDPLYQDFVCIESGGLRLDVPNGRYRVVVNMDNPSGFWGEYQVYRRRAIIAQGREVVAESMDFDVLKRKYFRFWNAEDRPSDNTFDKYQSAYFREKTFDVDVSNGFLRIDFRGDNWACSVSSIIVFPTSKAVEGERFLNWVKAKRRFYFDNYFKRVLHAPTGDPVQPRGPDDQRGYVTFQRDLMKDVFYNDRPSKAEVERPLSSDAFQGQRATVTLAVAAWGDLGKVTASVSDLIGPNGKIPSSAIDVGTVSQRIKRVTMDGSVYTIAPRLIMPESAASVPKGTTRQFWFTIRTPSDAKPGSYAGSVTVAAEHGAKTTLPLQLVVHSGTLDPVDVPAGPWGYSIDTPWYDDDPAAKDFEDGLALKSLRKMREAGFTAFSGVPSVSYGGFKEGRPILNFTNADRWMKVAKELGFLAVVSYGSGVQGFNPYYQDAEAMRSAGFKDYSAFVKAVYSAVQAHAREQGWLPVYWNLGDEPLGDELTRSIENATAYSKAFPKGPPFFTAASSFTGSKEDDPHFLLSRRLHVANWNEHDEASVKLLRKSGGAWAFYNGGNRWTYGDYMYKAAKGFGMKFRLAWHWNAAAGDPYYALDCREDDYAWCTGTPDGRLVRSIEFERLAAGLDDYRHLLTLARLAREQRGTPAALAAESLINQRLAAFKVGQRDHDALFPPDDWKAFRMRVVAAIDALRSQRR